MDVDWFLSKSSVMRMHAEICLAWLAIVDVVQATDGKAIRPVDQGEVLASLLTQGEPVSQETSEPSPASAPGLSYDGAPPPVEPRETMATLGFDVAYERPTSGDIEFIDRYTVMGGGGDDDLNFGAAFFSVGDVSFHSGGLADQVAANPLVFELGGLYRRYFFRRSAWINPYAVFGGSAEVLTWAYRQDQYIHGDTVGGDSVWGVSAHAGLGVAINRGHRLAAFAELTAGGTFYYGYTWCGFENDVFANHGFWSARAGIQYAF